ncbi:MAG: Ig-like domain-containing protein [Bacillota bacterium]
MLDANPGLTVQQVKDLLQQSSQEWGPPGQDHDYGWGRLDTYRAVARAGNHSESGAPPVPGHLSFTGHLNGGASADHLFTVNDTSYPINATLLMEGSGTSPDLDLYLYNGAGQEIGRAAGTSRQDQLVVAVNQTGTYRLQVRSYSGAGEYVVDVSAGTSGASDGEPTVTFDAPAEGAVLSGLVDVKVRATDDQQVSMVEVSVDGGSYQDVTGSFDGTHYHYLWDTVAWPDGNHTLHARATDSGGQQAQADRQVSVANGNQGGDQRWTGTGSVSPSARNSELLLNVAQPGWVDFTLAWGSSADLDLYVYAPDGTFAGRAYTLNNPERLRIDTVRWGTGEYRLRVNLYSGPASNFALTADGYQRMSFTGDVSAANRNVTHTQRMDFTGQSRVVLGWPTSSDLDFFVYDPTGRERTRAFTLNNPEMREFSLDTTGEWLVRVNLYSGPATGYTLHWFVPAAILS